MTHKTNVLTCSTIMNDFPTVLVLSDDICGITNPTSGTVEGKTRCVQLVRAVCTIHDAVAELENADLTVLVHRDVIGFTRYHHTSFVYGC